MADTYDLMNELALLDPGAVRVFLDEFEDLYLELDGEEPVGPLTVHRAFPVSAPVDFVVLRDAVDTEDGVVRRLSDLDRKSRAVLTDELDRNYFVTRITAVNAIDIAFHTPCWDVQTDRGPRAFDLHSGRRDIRVLDAGRVLIRDGDGNRYEIPDYRQLDRPSRLLVEAQL